MIDWNLVFAVWLVFVAASFKDILEILYSIFESIRSKYKV